MKMPLSASGPSLNAAVRLWTTVIAAAVMVE
jgi:hypothetical protein